MILLLGCKPPVEAPTELTELSAWLYRNQDDAEALPVGLAELDAWLDGHAGEEEGWVLPALTEEDVAEVDHPDRDLTVAIGAVAEAASPHDRAAHAAFVLLADQSIVNEDDYEQFDRTLLEGGGCFPTTCTQLHTWNVVSKNGAFGVVIPYEYGKNYHLVPYEHEGEARQAIVSRGWVPVESMAEDGENGILLSFTLDVFLDRPQGIHRVQAQWSELAFSVDLPEDFLLNELVDGLQGVFADTDAAILDLGL